MITIKELNESLLVKKYTILKLIWSIYDWFLKEIETIKLNILFQSTNNFRKNQLLFFIDNRYHYIRKEDNWLKNSYILKLI